MEPMKSMVDSLNDTRTGVVTNVEEREDRLAEFLEFTADEEAIEVVVGNS